MNGSDGTGCPADFIISLEFHRLGYTREASSQWVSIRMSLLLTPSELPESDWTPVPIILKLLTLWLMVSDRLFDVKCYAQDAFRQKREMNTRNGSSNMF